MFKKVRTKMNESARSPLFIRTSEQFNQSEINNQTYQMSKYIHLFSPFQSFE